MQTLCSISPLIHSKSCRYDGSSSPSSSATMGINIHECCRWKAPGPSWMPPEGILNCSQGFLCSHPAVGISGGGPVLLPLILPLPGLNPHCHPILSSPAPFNSFPTSLHAPVQTYLPQELSLGTTIGGHYRNQTLAESRQLDV